MDRTALSTAWSMAQHMSRSAHDSWWLVQAGVGTLQHSDARWSSNKGVLERKDQATLAFAHTSDHALRSYLHLSSRSFSTLGLSAPSDHSGPEDGTHDNDTRRRITRTLNCDALCCFEPAKDFALLRQQKTNFLSTFFTSNRSSSATV